MCSHLSLKWNNHIVAFSNLLSDIHLKEKFCDATIICQGMHYSVHKFILSTCSDYFNKIFDKLQCQHPCLIFNDIEPREMKLLISYMYKGEVNVLQDHLPIFIKAAEALQIKGLAVPDDIVDCENKKTPNERKRSSPRNNEGKKYRKHSEDVNSDEKSSQESKISDISNDKAESFPPMCEETVDTKGKIKDEPLELSELENLILPKIQNEYQETKFMQNFKQENCVQDENNDYLYNDNYINQVSSGWNEEPIQNINSTHVPSDNECRNEVQEMGQNCNRTLTEMRIESRKRLKSRHCPFCSYQSYNSKNVERHIFKHTGEKPFSCSYCSRGFITKFNLENHLRIHTGEKPFQCYRCLKKFAQKYNFNKHMLKLPQCSGAGRTSQIP